MEKLFECDRLRRDTLNEWLYMCLHGSTTDIQEVAHQSNYQTVMIIFLRAKKAWSIWNSVHKWEMFARKKNYFHFSTLHFIYQWQLKSSCVRTVTLKCWFCIVPCTNAIATRGVASNFAYQIVYWPLKKKTVYYVEKICSLFSTQELYYSVWWKVESYFSCVLQFQWILFFKYLWELKIIKFIEIK